MNFLDIKAGEPIEVGTQKAYRFWRYWIPDDGPVHLLSFVSDMRWLPKGVAKANPDIGEHGIHGFKTEELMMKSFCYKPEHLVLKSRFTGCDGVVLGTVEMWGIVWDHDKGYRAQFARPLSFDQSFGHLNDVALKYLRAVFFGRRPNDRVSTDL